MLQPTRPRAGLFVSAILSRCNAAQHKNKQRLLLYNYCAPSFSYQNTMYYRCARSPRGRLANAAGNGSSGAREGTLRRCRRPPGTAWHQARQPIRPDPTIRPAGMHEQSKNAATCPSWKSAKNDPRAFAVRKLHDKPCRNEPLCGNLPEEVFRTC